MLGVLAVAAIFDCLVLRFLKRGGLDRFRVLGLALDAFGVLGGLSGLLPCRFLSFPWFVARGPCGLSGFEGCNDVGVLSFPLVTAHAIVAILFIVAAFRLARFFERSLSGEVYRVRVGFVPDINRGAVGVLFFLRQLEPSADGRRDRTRCTFRRLDLGGLSGFARGYLSFPLWALSGAFGVVRRKPVGFLDALPCLS